MATKKKVTVEKEPATKPDFQKNDRVSGTVTYTVEKQRSASMVRMPHIDDPRMEEYARRRAYQEVQYMGDRYDEGYKVEDTYERVGNKDFFTVVTPPYKANGKWHMTVQKEGEKEQEVYCKDFHLVGERRVVEPLMTKETKEKLTKMAKLSKPAIVTGVILLIALIIGGWFVGNYNDLVRADNSVDNSKAKIDTELTRRYDLIDNIVASVKGSQAQESDVFGKIAEARKQGGSTTDPEKQAEANAAITTQIALLPRLQEAYPELRSNDQVTRLITELQGTNGTIRDKRNEYNDTVTNYNNNITSFPKSIFAGLFGFEKAKLFEATAQERVNPNVDLNRE